MLRQHYILLKLKLHITNYKYKYYKGTHYKIIDIARITKITRIVTEVQSYEREVCVRKYDRHDIETKKRK